MSLHLSTSYYYALDSLNQSNVEISNAVPPARLVSRPEAHQYTPPPH